MLLIFTFQLHARGQTLALVVTFLLQAPAKSARRRRHAATGADRGGVADRAQPLVRIEAGRVSVDEYFSEGIGYDADDGQGYGYSVAGDDYGFSVDRHGYGFSIYRHDYGF